ncbi:hypothetical protein ITP31_003982 [Salmonella enterica]|nr:hypothetical protein [Salmonella enterica]
MFKFIKDSKDLAAANVDAEVIKRAQKRFNGVDAMVSGWVVQSVDSGKILWAVADIGFSKDLVRQFGMICMNEGKPLVYVNMKDLAFYVPELANSMISWDTTSVSLGLNNAIVVGTAYSTIATVSKATRLFNEGRAREAMSMNPPVTIVSPKEAGNDDYMTLVNKARRENGMLVIGNDVPEAHVKQISDYAESVLMVETVRMVALPKAS